MSYLAISAAPYSNDNNIENNDLDKKKLSRNSTPTNKSDLLIDNEKVNQVLETINNLHKNMNTSDNDNEEFADFNPPPPPTSSGVQRTISKEPFQPQQYPSPSSFDPTLNNYKDNYGTEESVNEYYKKYIPNYSQPINIKQKEDILIEKLNYMIHLLEEQHDERTNTVMEEVVLYSFLGIFIIYIADSFTRIGKYTR